MNESKNKKSLLYMAKDYLPSYFSSEWSCYNESIGSKCKMICNFDSNNILHVATYDGHYYRLSGDDFSVIRRSELYTNN